MNHRTFRRALATDVLAAALLLILYLLAQRALAPIGRHLPGGGALWAAIAVTFLVAAGLFVWLLCRAAAKVDALLAEAEHQPSVIDVIDTVGEQADVIDFEFPQQPRLVLIRGGRDMRELPR